MFIAHLARTGSPGLAADAVGKSRYGVEKVCKGEGAESFRAAWDGAVALFEERDARRREAVFAGTAASRPPFVDRRRRLGEHPDGPPPGKIRNEHGEYEDEANYHRRADEARDSISAKILNARRLYLKEISASPGKRAAFEILTKYPIDWDRAERLQAQEDEPFRKPNMHQPDMLLTAENGWLGDFAHRPDKKAELRKALDEHRAKLGLPAVEWDFEPPSAGE